MHARARTVSAVVAAILSASGPAFAEPAEDPAADAPGQAATPPPADAAPAADTAPAPPDAKTRPVEDPRRLTDLTPRPVTPPTTARAKFTADPIGDGGVIILGVTFGVLSGAVLGTGEVRPQQISPSFRSSQLLKIDRGAISQKIDPRAKTLSNVGVGLIGGYVLLDTILDGFREGPTAALVDTVMYVEAITITQGLTNLAKISFRRPRPHAYIERNEYIARGGDPATFQNGDTDSALSFFSGHSSQAAALSAAATYIAFSRSPGTPRPWLTLAGGTALTSFVAYERVRSGAHFPTDVIAGAIAGTAVGALVVHLHRADPMRQRPLWIGFAPSGDGATLSASGLF
jgi:membrane-associated phospholipid phosphatase